LKPGDTIMGMSLAEGGHLTHGMALNMSGKWFNVVSYGLDSNEAIDYDAMEAKAREHKPKLIVAGASAYSLHIDWARFAKVAKDVSLDAATKAQGGLVGWVASQQLAPQIANVVGSLAKGSFTKTPIKVGDAWVIVRLDDTRSGKIASFEASKNQLKQAIIQQHMNDVIRRLRETSRVVQ
jgi:hypothetical protein